MSPKKSSSKRLPIVLLVILLFGAGGYYFYQNNMADAEAAEEPAMQTAKVRTGDLVLYANGSGLVVPASEASFGFRSGGQVVALPVAVGDSVQAGDLLAELNNTAQQVKLQQAERDLAELTSPLALAKSEQELAAAENDLIDARNTLIYQISPSVFNAENKIAELQASIAEAEASGSDDATMDDLKSQLEYAERTLNSALYLYESEYLPETFTVAATRTTPAYFAPPSDADIYESRANYLAAQPCLSLL